MRSIIKVLTCVLLALVVFVPVRTSWAHEYTPAEKKMIDDYVYYYNNERPQWTRNKMTPAEYEDYLNSLSDNEYSDYLQNEQEKYDKMMKKAREKALKRAVELGALTEEDMELYGSDKKEEQAAADRGAETCA